MINQTVLELMVILHVCRIVVCLCIGDYSKGIKQRQDNLLCLGTVDINGFFLSHTTSSLTKRKHLQYVFKEGPHILSTELLIYVSYKVPFHNGAQLLQNKSIYRTVY